MTTISLHRLAGQLRQAAGPGDVRDSDLPDRFRRGDESAFAALVRRHGPAVLAACRSVLRDEADVEDAFQATFLALVRGAGSIRRGAAVGGWLYGVARRVAFKARGRAARRRLVEGRAAPP